LIAGETITLVAQATGTTRPYPDCGATSSRVHSHYTRRLTDLPWQGRAVRIELKARRFFCPATACSRQTFAERLPEFVAVSARTTARPQKAQQLIGQALGGEAGARLATPLGMSTSPAPTPCCGESAVPHCQSDPRCGCWGLMPLIVGLAAAALVGGAGFGLISLLVPRA
jgi:hypothetical protein